MRHILIVILPALIFFACSQEERHAVPRRTAYPRPQLLDTMMVAASDAPLFFLVNVGAKVDPGGAGDLTVKYDAYGATMYVAFTETNPSDFADVVANRQERMELNIGDKTTEYIEFENSDGYQVLLAYSEGAVTPLQFRAVKDSAMVVSGAVFFADPKAVQAVDSIFPTINALRSDLMRSMVNLKSYEK